MNAMSALFAVNPAEPPDAAAHFAARLAYETDVSDVHHDMESRDRENRDPENGAPGWVLVDTRSREAWEQGHIPGAVHLPTNEIAARAADLIGLDTAVVTYCWGPGCNGSTRAALEFARRGYRVKEMLGGYEYWVREGFATQTLLGIRSNDVDPLTAPASGAACAC
jgi:rhodanese-related sulfurtransferase